MSAPLGILVWDEPSALVHVLASMSLVALEREAQLRALTLALTHDLRDVPNLTVGEWIAGGLFGSEPFSDDPVRQRIAGLSFETTHGELIDIRPAPRRAVGPDWIGAVVGTGETFGRVRSAWLTLFPIESESFATFSFAQHKDAEAALARMRGLGVRLFGSRVEANDHGTTLALRFRAPAARSAVYVEVARECAALFRGLEIPASKPASVANEVTVSPFLRALGAPA